MNKDFLDLIDLNTPDRYTLSIRLSSGGFCFSLYDNNQEGGNLTLPYKVNPVSSMMGNVKELLDYMTPIETCSLRRVNVIVDTPKVTFVPFSIFDEEDKKDLFSMCFPLQSGDDVIHSILGSAGCVSLFALNGHVRRFIDSKFENVSYNCTAGILAGHFSGIAFGISSNSMFVYVEDETVGVYCFKGAELLFANVFECGSDSDRTYFIMNAWQNLKLSQLDDRLYLVSDKVDLKGLKNMLSLYVSNLYDVEREAGMKNLRASGSVDMPFDVESLVLKSF